MKDCKFPGCLNKRTTATCKRKSFHTIPVADAEVRRLWLTALRLDCDTSAEVSQHWIVCSDHFEPEDFYPKETELESTLPKKRAGLRKHKQKRNPKKERTRLRPHAVPRTATSEELPSASPTTHPDTTQGGGGAESEDLFQDYEGVKCSTPTKSQTTQRGHSTQLASPIIHTPPELMSEPEIGHVEEGPDCRFKKDPAFYMHLSTPPQPQQTRRTRPSSSGQYMARPPTFFLEDLPSTSHWSSQTEHSTEEGQPQALPPNEDLISSLDQSYGEMDIDDSSEDDEPDTSYLPSEETPSSESFDEEESTNKKVLWDPSRRWIVDESHIMELLDFCSKCGKKILLKDPYVAGGSRLQVKWECEGGCIASWCSSPKTDKRTADNNIVCSAAIFYTGATYTDIFEWAQLVNLQIPKKTLFYSIQKKYLIPVIHAAYRDHNNSIIELLRERSLSGERIELCGDGRSDSPGHSAKYTTYSFQDDATKKVVHFELVQVSESGSSAGMELIGFKRGLEKLGYLGVPVGLIATDRSPSIKSLMRTPRYESVLHEFDPWHVGKGLKKRLLAEGIKARNKPLQPWIKAINNHMYWSCEMSGGDPEKCVKQWKSLVHHILGVHRWEEDNVEHRCNHRDYTAEEQARKKWLTADSSAFRVVQSIVLDANIIRDLRQMAQFKHTGSLEVFHNSLLKYTPKRSHFFYDSMLARTMLAVIDHNKNVGREQATTKQGKMKLKVQVTKATRNWVAKPQYQATQQLPFRRELLADTIDLSRTVALDTKEERAKKKFPRVNVAKDPKPELDVLMSRQKESESRRFSHHKSR